MTHDVICITVTRPTFVLFYIIPKAGQNVKATSKNKKINAKSDWIVKR